MIFRTIEVTMRGYDSGTVWLTGPTLSDIDVHGDFVSRFEEHGNLRGEKIIEFDSNIRMAQVALKGFHFETENDHNLSKIKLDITVAPRGNYAHVFAVAAFKDDSPKDDFDDKPFIMKATVLLIVEL
jgi:hypothetical protein